MLVAQSSSFDPGLLFRLVDVAGVVANGFLGGALARRMGFDLIGFLVLGMSSGLAGGALRDMLLGAGPAVVLTDPAYLTGAMLAATTAYVLDIRGRFAGRILTLVDMLAVGCWSATGAAKALGMGLGWLPALFLGTVTAVGGGIARDVLVGRVPTIFGGNPLYASVAVVGSAQMTLLATFGHHQIGMATAIVSCAALGLLARRRGWVLPAAAERPAVSRRPWRKRGSSGRSP
ncbi:MAG: TRIC cation channel family protein [Austwickia sp.]|nr:TRIC cation channel family protein [Austwickia sp.]MBK8436484.1 TRIC cation channel family protein [Austwickia sp.]MBK9102161.1 TRIC cation channel family protein [Austwickia sp.]